MNSPAAWSNRRTPRCAGNASSAKSTRDAADARCARPVSRAIVRIARCSESSGRDGAFAEFLRLPDVNLIPIPDSIPDDVAVFVEPIAAAYEIFEQVHLARNETVVVIGDGRLGALVALALKGEKYLPIIAGHHREKLERLAELGLDTADESSLETNSTSRSIAAEANRVFGAQSNWSGRAERSY